MFARAYLRPTSIFTLFVFCCALILPAPVAAASFEETAQWIKNFPKRFFRRIKKPEKKISNPEELQELFDEVKAKTFDENPAQRDEVADWKRPASQVSLALLDGQIGIVKQFMAFQAANAIKGVGKKALTSKAWATAGQVVGKMTGDSAHVLNSALAHSKFGKNFFALIAKNGAFQKSLLRESNFVLMGLIVVLINSGIYDGLDVDSMKDHVVSIAPLCTDWTYDKGLPAQLMYEFINRQLYSGFNGFFDKIYQSALNNKSIWGQALNSLDAKANLLGQKLFKATRLGIQTSSEQSLASKMGLVGVGEGIQFTLGGLFQRLAVGGAFAVGGQFILDSTFAVARGFQNRTYLGGNRNKYWVQQDINAYQYQKTGNKWKDELRERYIRLRDVLHTRIKWPIRSIVVPISGLMGGYFGSVLAGALFIGGGPLTLVGGTLVSSLLAGLGTFVGNWAATKLDRGKTMMKFRRNGYIKMVTKELKETPDYRDGKLSDDKIKEIAELRADDFEKIEKVGQVTARMLFVDHAHNVMLGKKGDYWKIIIPDEHGTEFCGNAEIRYDIIDMDGNRWVYDIHTNKVRNVGKVADNNGRFIVFLNAKGVLIENDIIVNREKDDPERTLHVFDNGVILEKRGEEWTVRGQGSDRDIFFRDSEERFEWREAAFRRAKGPADAEVPKAPVGQEPLEGYADLVKKTEDAQLQAAVLNMSQNQIKGVRQSLYKDLEGMNDLEEVQSYLADIAEQLGVFDGQSEPSAPGNLFQGDIEMARNIVKGKVERYLQRMSETLTVQIEQTEVKELRESFARVQTEYPMSDEGPDHETLGNRMRNVPVWGTLSVLGNKDAVLAAALHSTSR